MRLESPEFLCQKKEGKTRSSSEAFSPLPRQTVVVFSTPSSPNGRPLRGRGGAPTSARHAETRHAELEASQRDPFPTLRPRRGQLL